ncbi:hypothetical protein CBR_g31450 [Chara braunii]|uniref:F-box domain-containing protein n=1 Tax=Chara braunii TaxID=69332 RepID=A0A388LF09_CHABU|nr:hypothetical protein CBR_g31450 [Chara braunii]|eukprot:GBG80894.1 hypothetical protein CBR_g31450 [Chara braunii]
MASALAVLAGRVGVNCDQQEQQPAGNNSNISPIFSLPRMILQSIFARLPGESIAAVLGVCKDWRAAILEAGDMLWKEVFLHQFGRNITYWSNYEQPPSRLERASGGGGGGVWRRRYIERIVSGRNWLRGKCRHWHLPKRKFSIDGGHTDDHRRDADVAFEQEDECSVSMVHVEGNLLVTGMWDGDVKVWNLEEGRQMWTMQGHMEYIQGIDVDVRQGLLATSSKDGMARVWSLRTGNCLYVMVHSTPCEEIWLVNDSAWFLSTQTSKFSAAYRAFANMPADMHFYGSGNLRSGSVGDRYQQQQRGLEGGVKVGNGYGYGYDLGSRGWRNNGNGYRGAGGGGVCTDKTRKWRAPFVLTTVRQNEEDDGESHLWGLMDGGDCWQDADEHGCGSQSLQVLRRFRNPYMLDQRTGVMALGDGSPRRIFLQHVFDDRPFLELQTDGMPGCIKDVCFSHSDERGWRLVVASEDAEVMVIDILSRKVVSSFHCAPAPDPRLFSESMTAFSLNEHVYCLTFSLSNRVAHHADALRWIGGGRAGGPGTGLGTLLGGGDVGGMDPVHTYTAEFRVWDAEEGRQVGKNLEMEVTMPLADALVFDAQQPGKRNVTAVLGGADGRLTLWNLPSERAVQLPWNLAIGEHTFLDAKSNWRWLVVKDESGVHVFDFLSTTTI